jgi:hypothetical protein
LARNVFSMYLSDLLELLLGSADNVDLCTIDGKRLCDHQADTRSATCDKSDLVFEIVSWFVVYVLVLAYEFLVVKLRG